MPFLESGFVQSRRRSLWANFWHYIYLLPSLGSGMLFAVRPRRSYAQVLSTGVLSPESLENRRRRERLLFYHLADLTNPDHYPWEHLEACPGLPDVSFRLRADAPRSRRCWEEDCAN
eukprot:5663434-Amphidinium_carterae.1